MFDDFKIENTSFSFGIFPCYFFDVLFFDVLFFGVLFDFNGILPKFSLFFRNEINYKYKTCVKRFFSFLSFCSFRPYVFATLALNEI